MATLRCIDIQPQHILVMYAIEYPRCHLHFLRTHTVFELIVHIFEENTCTCDLWVISCYKNSNYYCIS